MKPRGTPFIVAGVVALLVGGGPTVPPANPCASSPPAKAVSGTVKAASATRLLIEQGGTQWTFALSEAIVDRVPQLKAGTSVEVRYIEAGGKRTAVQVTVQAGSSPEMRRR